MSSKKSHPEWTKENSLTSPEDRDKENKWRPEQSSVQISEEEVNDAMKELNNTQYIEKFPKLDRTYQDPQVPMQNIGLVSFVPAKGAVPNQNGVYGFAKLRGNYATNTEADQRAEFLIRYADSYHQIYHTYVGRPFPLTISSDYSAETTEIDIRKETVQAVSSSVKDKKEEEQKVMREIKEREENLLEESKKAKEDDGTKDIEVDPYENYITLSVKKAQLSWTFKEHLTKMKEVREFIIKTRAELKDLDQEYPEFAGKYLDKYMQARKDAGIDESTEDLNDNFMNFMVEEKMIPTIDTDEKLPEFE
jgi:hypothetical protein|uniref:Uncharacterized protein n=1 Tax=viral metagenome TaxID=1070528 RepID=A0A6C0IZ38_9ZZZZ